MLNGVEQNCKRWGDTMLFGKGKGKQEKISEVNPVCCTERVSDEAVETTGPRDEDVAGNQCFAFVREDVYEEIEAVVTEIFRCMYGHSVNLCFPDNPEFNSLRSNM